MGLYYVRYQISRRVIINKFYLLISLCIFYEKLKKNKINNIIISINLSNPSIKTHHFDNGPTFKQYIFVLLPQIDDGCLSIELKFIS